MGVGEKRKNRIPNPRGACFILLMPEGEKCVVLHYVGYDRDHGGILTVIRTLAAAGDFDSVLGVNPSFRQEAKPALAIRAFGRIEGERIGLRPMLKASVLALRARGWLRADRARIFHGHSRAGLLIALWLRLLGERRVLASVHSYGRQRWFYRAAAKMMGARLYWLGPAMKRYYGVESSGWEHCVPDCVPAARGPSPGPRRSSGQEICFGCVGALVPVKQWELVLAALALVPPGLPLRVLHAGGTDGSAESADYERRLRQRADELGVSSRIEWRGQVSAMETVYAEIDCLVVAARREASSVAALEAAAAGVPTLASDVAGTRDLVEKAKLGWLFPADDAAALAGRMTALATGSELGAWRRDDEAMRFFTAPVVASRWAEIYRRLLAA